jgi:hypothetical protein
LSGFILLSFEGVALAANQLEPGRYRASRTTADTGQRDGLEPVACCLRARYGEAVDGISTAHQKSRRFDRVRI